MTNLHRRQDGESRLASESDASLINTGFFSPFTGRAAGIQSLQASISKRLCRTVSETSVRQVYERCGASAQADDLEGSRQHQYAEGTREIGLNAGRLSKSGAEITNGHRSPFAPLTYPEMP